MNFHGMVIGTRCQEELRVTRAELDCVHRAVVASDCVGVLNAGVTAADLELADFDEAVVETSRQDHTEIEINPVLSGTEFLPKAR